MSGKHLGQITTPVTAFKDTDRLYVLDETEALISNQDKYATYSRLKADLQVAIGTLSAVQVKNLYESNANTNVFTDAEKLKLQNIIDLFRGQYATSAALTTAYPTSTAGTYAFVANGSGGLNVWVWDSTGAAWVDTGGQVAGMQAEIYDPRGIALDIYDRANHTGNIAISVVTGLQSALDSLQASINLLSADVEGIDTRLGNVEATVSQHTTGINNLINRVGITEQDITNIENQLSTFVKSVNGIGPDANGNVLVQIGEGGGLTRSFADIVSGELKMADAGDIVIYQASNERSITSISGMAAHTPHVLAINGDYTVAFTPSVNLEVYGTDPGTGIRVVQIYSPDGIKVSVRFPGSGGGTTDLSNYYTRDETYSQQEVDDLLANTPTGGASLEPFAATLSLNNPFGKDQSGGTYQQTAAINFSIASSGNVLLASIRREIQADGVNALNFTADFDEFNNITPNQPLTAGKYALYFLYKGSGKVAVSAVLMQAGGGTPPPDTTPPSAPQNIVISNVTTSGYTATANPSTDN
jgi:hypothetical protein